MAKIFQPTKRALPSAQVLDVVGLNNEGQGISKAKGKTVFVDGALPGERVKAKFTEVKGRYLQAAVQTVLKRSDSRVEPQCCYADQCGGCGWWHVHAREQILLKQQLLLESLKRHAQISPLALAEPILSEPKGYRVRTRLSIWFDENRRVSLGYHLAASKKIVPINECLVLSPNLSALLLPLRMWVEEFGAEKTLGHVELLQDDQHCAVLIRSTKELSTKAHTVLTDCLRSFAVDIWLHCGNSEPQCINRDNPPSYGYCLPEFDVSIAFSIRDFIQVNPAVNRQMVSQAVDWLRLDSTRVKGSLGRILDLFCGVGNFSIPLATCSQEVVGVELVESMVEQARANAAVNGMENALFVGADLADGEKHPSWLDKEFDGLLLDPPRAGAKEAMGFIEKLKVPNLVYVSCNPATFVRDAKVLSSQGYTLDRLGVMDMFPQTKHTESMALFTLR